MAEKMSGSRRNFLKASALGAASLAVLGPQAKKAAAATISAKTIPLNTTPINQDIENLRVAYITDQAMLRSSNYPGFDSFNNATNTTTGVVYSVVKDNIDKLACALANKTSIADAWATIFKIPSTKTWATAKAAIKVNAFANDHPCVPIVAKICEVLIGKGIVSSNITIFDMNPNPSEIYSSYTGAGKQIPAGVVYSGAGGTTLQFPAASGGYSFPASSCLDGADIFVNIAVNKGHDRIHSYSGVTMCQKNMKGAVDFGHQGEEPAGDPVGGPAKLVAVNSCDYVVGNIPAAYPAKMQLCIVDSLWGGREGDWSGAIDNGNDLYSIAMGTFPGAVDYVSTMKIRAKKFGNWYQPIVDKFITGYGYSAADITTLMAAASGAGKGLVDASKTAVGPAQIENSNLMKHGMIRVALCTGGIGSVADLYIAKGETPVAAEIHDVSGRLVRTLATQVGAMQIVWDGKNDAGSRVRSGSYIVTVFGQKTRASAEILVGR